jgi:mannose-binding lectin 2
VDLMYKKEDEWTNCFEVAGVKVPGLAYLGFSAETGELSDNHDIIKVDTRNMYSPSATLAKNEKANSRNKYNTSRGKKQSSGGGGWGWFFLKFVLFGMVVAGGYVGFTMYRASRRRDRF